MNQLSSQTSPWVSFRNWLAAAAVLAVCGFGALWLDLWMAHPEEPDWMPGDLSRILDLSELFAHGFGVILTFALIWTLDPEKRRHLPRLLACVVFPSVVTHSLKALVGRARPLAYKQPDWSFQYPESISETWIGFLPDGILNSEYMNESFVSAHTTTAVALAMGLSWLYPRGRWLFVFVAVLASMQRVSSQAHWMSDVCWGAAISLAIGGAVLSVPKRVQSLEGSDIEAAVSDRG